MIDVGIDEEEWNMFLVCWSQFKVASNLPVETVSLQLFNCASEALGNLILKADPFITNPGSRETDVLSAMRSFAVIRVSKATQRRDLMKMT